MDFISALLITIFVICVYVLFSSRRKAANLPPGPPAFPLVGHIPLLRPREFLAYTRFKKYGPICTLRLGQVDLVLLNSYEAIQEAFLGQAEIFSGRRKSEYLDALVRHSGILFQDGPLWQEHRRITLRLMREFGSGRDTGETIIQEECLAMKDWLMENLETPVNTKLIFSSTINNVIARLIFGERCGTDDPNFHTFTKQLEELVQVRFMDILPVIVPWITKIPPLLGLVESTGGGIRQRLETLHKYVLDRINQRRDAIRSMDPPPTEISQASNICEAFLIEQAKQEAANPGHHTFTEWQLIRNMFELFLAGTDTTATSLKWTTLLLAIHPEVQTRVQKEIEEHVGRDRSPTMSDKQQLPYVCAVMDEVQRYSSLAPTVEHCVLKDTELMGYSIPAKMLVTANLYGVHHDPELWARPDEFYPEHFLSPEGDYRPSKYLIPFSIGKRACLGESLARMEFFLALVTLMQTFRVRLSDPKADLDAILLGTPGIVRHPQDHEIIFSAL